MSKLRSLFARYFEICSIGTNLYLIAPCNLAEFANINLPEQGFILQWSKDPTSHGFR